MSSGRLLNPFTMGMTLCKEMQIDDRDVRALYSFRDVTLSRHKQSYRTGISIIYDDHGTTFIVLKKFGCKPIKHRFANKLDVSRFCKFLRFEKDYREIEIAEALGITQPSVSILTNITEKELRKSMEKARNAAKNKAKKRSEYRPYHPFYNNYDDDGEDLEGIMC